MAQENKKPKAYELYLVCKSNISIVQGKNPEEPKNKNPDFYVGDVFQAKQSSEYKKFMQLRAASRGKHRQWLLMNEPEDGKEQESKPVVHHPVMKMVPPSVSEYYHLDIGMTATRKCKVLQSVVSRSVDTVYGLNLSALSGVLVGYLPFSYPIFTICGTLMRGRGHFTQFCVPYAHSKSQCKEFLRKIKLLRRETVEALEGRTVDETERLRMEWEYEKKLMLQQRDRMKYALQHDPEEQTAENEELFEMDDEEKEREEALDAHALNEIVSVKKEELPGWITSVFASIPSANGYYFCIELYFMESHCRVPFEKDEYLEQNKHLDFEITNKDGNTSHFVWSEPRLVATKQAPTLGEMIDVNEAGGSRWFDVMFDAKNDPDAEVFLEEFDHLICKVGGRWQDGGSRHYMDVRAEDGTIFSEYLPMFRINLVV